VERRKAGRAQTLTAVFGAGTTFLASFVHSLFRVPRRAAIMSSNYQIYVANFNRMRISEMIDYYATTARMSRATASLVANPLTGQFYGEAWSGVSLDQDNQDA
jgi:hypothetical protein